MAGRTPFKRTDRVGAELRREVGMLVHQGVRDAMLPEISVSDVEVTRDFAHATVYFTALDDAAAEPALAMLKEMAKGMRMQLARRLRLRTTPELHFRYDNSVEQGERIERLLRDVLPGEESPEVADPGSGTEDPGRE